MSYATRQRMHLKKDFYPIRHIVCLEDNEKKKKKTERDSKGICGAFHRVEVFLKSSGRVTGPTCTSACGEDASPNRIPV